MNINFMPACSIHSFLSYCQCSACSHMKIHKSGTEVLHLVHKLNLFHDSGKGCHTHVHAGKTTAVMFVFVTWYRVCKQKQNFASVFVCKPDCLKTKVSVNQGATSGGQVQLDGSYSRQYLHDLGSQHISFSWSLGTIFFLLCSARTCIMHLWPLVRRRRWPQFGEGFPCDVATFSAWLLNIWEPVSMLMALL